MDEKKEVEKQALDELMEENLMKGELYKLFLGEGKERVPKIIRQKIRKHLSDYFGQEMSGQKDKHEWKELLKEIERSVYK
mgnify:CR=1 FL=1